MDLSRQFRECLHGRVCLMGLGNEDYADDGFGVRLAEELVAKGAPGAVAEWELQDVEQLDGAPPSTAAGPAWELNAPFQVMVAGSTPERYISRATSEGFQHIVFLDAVEFGGSPGDVVFLNSSEMQARFPQISTHKISLSVLAIWAESTGDTQAWLLGVQPESIKAGQPLSATVRRTLDALKTLLLQCEPSRAATLANSPPRKRWVAAPGQ
jgi:hydrogenase 3 maturation protease